MVNRHISEDLKECAVGLYERGWSSHDICDVLAVSRASFFRWYSCYRSHSSVVQPRSALKGRPRKISRAVLDAIEILIHLHPETYLDELVWWLGFHHQIVVSRADSPTCGAYTQGPYKTRCGKGRGAEGRVEGDGAG